MSAIRKLAAEAADNGLLAPELAAGIRLGIIGSYVMWTLPLDGGNIKTRRYYD